MKKLFLICLLGLIPLVSGCTNSTGIETTNKVDKCLLESHKGISDLDFNVYCIDGIQYIKSGYGISAYWETNRAGTSNPLIRRCTCK